MLNGGLVADRLPSRRHSMSNAAKTIHRLFNNARHQRCLGRLKFIVIGTAIRS